MNGRDLIRQSNIHFQQQPVYLSAGLGLSIFSKGAAWMAGRLNELNNHHLITFDPAVPFNALGWFKYGLCLSAFLFSAFLLFQIHFLLVPFSILVFYFLEVHFLFLFPLLLDRVKHPLWSSIKTSYRIGIFKCMITVIPIAYWMLVGLLRKNQPLQNWHVGALAVLIWYNDEIRTRL